MTIGRMHIAVFLGLAVAIWFVALLIFGTSVTLQHLAPFSVVVSGLVIVQLLIEYRLWSKSWLHGWFIKRPDIRGTWRVVLYSDWADPITNKTKDPILCYAGIKQSLSSLQLHLMTPESESWLVANSVVKSPSEHGYQIVAVYTNKPNIHLRTQSSTMHLGALIIDTHGSSIAVPDKLTAEYWTDRKTIGTMEFSDKTDKIYTKYVDANTAFEQES